MERSRIVSVPFSNERTSEIKAKNEIQQLGSPGGRVKTAILPIALCLEKKFCENDSLDFPYFFSKTFISNRKKEINSPPFVKVVPKQIIYGCLSFKDQM